MQEGLATEHSRELLRDALEQLLDGGAVADECAGHLETTRWDVTHGSLHVVRDPLDEIAAVLVLHVQHLLVDLLHGHAASEDRCHGKVTTVTGITGGHHVLGVKHLLRQLWHGQGAVLLAASGRQRSEAGYEEVQTWEWHHVDGEFPQIGVQLAGESEAGRDTGHRSGDQMVEVSVRWRRQLECAEADVVQSLVVDAECFVCVLDELVDGQSSIVRLDDCIGHLREHTMT